MECPKCGTKMREAGIIPPEFGTNYPTDKLLNDPEIRKKVFERSRIENLNKKAFGCPNCHYEMQPTFDT